MREMQSRLDYLWFIYRSELSWLVALGLFALSLPFAWLPVELVTVGAIIGAAAALVGLVGAGRSIFVTWRRAKLEQIARPIRGDVVAEWTPEGGHSAIVQHAGADRTAFWWDRDVNDALRWRSIGHDPVVGRVRAGRYRLPTRLQEIAGRGLRYGKVAGKARRENRKLPIRFNGRLLRLASEPTVEAIERGVLDFERVTYFDGECSNELWTARAVVPGWSSAAGGDEAQGVVDRYACDRAGRMLALDYANVANIVGISVLAVTTDGHAVLVRQSAGNSVAPSAWASSGSGSLERRDLHAAGSAGHAAEETVSHPFNAVGLIISGMLRELREESLLTEEEIDPVSARITAYWRWAERAMKPEFAGIVRLKVSAADLDRRKHRGTERAFSAQVVATPLQPLLDGVGRGESPLHGPMSPSCEVAILAAADFLASPEGVAWRSEPTA
ncbi:hypothetical protein [Agrococcus sp. Marseille-P2731]|uniref:hypothetical protein n=1 Tax=Agrococcus sp. Marseille-P2731 TaxID=1841862 RepID=UPI0009314C71|nr:hypothetical protein [Agrococcus sp. Marseille-P2731]